MFLNLAPWTARPPCRCLLSGVCRPACGDINHHHPQPTAGSQRGISGHFLIRHSDSGWVCTFQSRTRGAFRRLHRAAHGQSHAAQMKLSTTRDSDQKIYGVLVRGQMNNRRFNGSVAPLDFLARTQRLIKNHKRSGSSLTCPSLAELAHLPSKRSVYHNCWALLHQAHPSCCPLRWRPARAARR